MISPEGAQRQVSAGEVTAGKVRMAESSARSTLCAAMSLLVIQHVLWAAAKIIRIGGASGCRETGGFARRIAGATLGAVTMPTLARYGVYPDREAVGEGKLAARAERPAEPEVRPVVRAAQEAAHPNVMRSWKNVVSTDIAWRSRYQCPEVIPSMPPK